MFIAVDKNSILNLFKVDTFSELESVLELMSPSLVEYHLMSFLNGENTSYFDKKDVETSLYFGEYSLYIDYNKNIFIELNKTTSSIPTLTPTAEEKQEEIKKIEDNNKAFNPVISQNLLDNSFEHKNNEETEDEKTEEDNIFAYEHNSQNISNENNSKYYKNCNNN